MQRDLHAVKTRRSPSWRVLDSVWGASGEIAPKRGRGYNLAQESSMAETWISVTEAARLTGYSRKQILRLVRAGKVKARKIVTVWQIDRASLLAYLRKMAKLGAKTGPKPRA